MLNATNSRKALNFDLNDNLLQKGNYKNGWRDISSFLQKNGFIHRQYSGYVSSDIITYAEVSAIIREMDFAHPWIGSCIKEFDVTAVLEEYSLKDMFSENYKVNQLLENSLVNENSRN